jgi:hypothetical protein
MSTLTLASHLSGPLPDRGRRQPDFDVNSKGHPMSAYHRYPDAAACCAFCAKPLPVINGQLQPWRAASGQFFCNEFCADDAEEARFQSRGRTERSAHSQPAW